MTAGAVGGVVDWRRVARVLLLVVGVAIVCIFIASAVPAVAGADQSFVVQSSSMSPSIKAGAVVFVSDVDPGDVSAGDVVTFTQNSERDGVRVTHRVIDVLDQEGDIAFRTKGEANEEADPQLVTEGALVGRVDFHVPLVGYVIAFAGTQLGLVSLVVVPALLLVALELRDLWRASQSNGADGEDSTGDIANSADESPTGQEEEVSP